jgi:hypothetical protein
LPVDREARSVTLRCSVSFSRLRFSRAQRDHWDFRPSGATVRRRENDAGAQSTGSDRGRRISKPKAEAENFTAQEEIDVAFAKIDSEEKENAERRIGTVGNSKRDAESEAQEISYWRRIAKSEKEKNAERRFRNVSHT